MLGLFCGLGMYTRPAHRLSRGAGRLDFANELVARVRGRRVRGDAPRLFRSALALVKSARSRSHGPMCVCVYVYVYVFVYH